MTEQIIIPPVPELPAEVPVAVEAPEKPTSTELGWTLAMTEELAIRKRFKVPLEEVSDDDTWAALAFVLRLRQGIGDLDAYAAVDALTTRAARSEFRDAEVTAEEVEAYVADLQALWRCIEAVADELNGPERRLIAEYFAAPRDELSGWDQARALVFVQATRDGAPAKDAKKAAAQQTRRDALDQLKVLADAAGKDARA